MTTIRTNQRSLILLTLVAIVSLVLFPVLLQDTSLSPEISNNDYFETAQWLSGWEYRKLHDIEGSAGAETNYQMRIQVDYHSGSDSGSTVHLDSHCNADFSDIRFTDDDGSTQLDYWMEQSTPGDYAVFWVEVKDNLDTSQQIYIYYGNDAAESKSSGEDTFLFFDDYEDQDLAEWSTVTGDCTIDSSQAKHGDYSLMLYDSPGPKIDADLTQNGNPLTHGFMIHNWVRDNDQLRGGHAPLVRSVQEGSKWAVRGYESSFQYYEGEYKTWPQNSGGGSDTWFELELGVSYSRNRFLAWKDGMPMGEIDLIANNGNSIPDDIYNFGYSQQSYYRTWYDDTYVRKWIVDEPESIGWDAEEVVTEYTPTTETSDPGNTPDSVQMSLPLMLGIAIPLIGIAVIAIAYNNRSPNHEQAITAEVETTPPSREPPMNPEARRKVILGALKSYPRITIEELSDMSGMPDTEVREITLGLIADDRVSGTFDRSTDEFVSADATRTSREIKSHAEGPSGLPRCPYCGAPLEKTLGVGETGECPSCGRRLMG